MQNNQSSESSKYISRFLSSKPQIWRGSIHLGPGLGFSVANVHVLSLAVLCVCFWLCLPCFLLWTTQDPAKGGAGRGLTASQLPPGFSDPRGRGYRRTGSGWNLNYFRSPLCGPPCGSVLLPTHRLVRMTSKLRGSQEIVPRRIL